MKVIPTILRGWVLYCSFLLVWAKVAEKIKVTKPKPPTGLPVTIVTDEYQAHFIKQGKITKVSGIVNFAPYISDMYERLR